MKPFAYTRAEEVGAAATAVAERPGAVFLAGGTNLVDLMKLGVATPEALVDISHLGLDAIEHRDDGSTRIGATVTNAELAGDPGVRARFPVLSQALLAGASGQLRQAATTGGNLLQRTRCTYFQDVAKPCNKRRPGSGCPAITGAHRDLGVLGTSEACVATHPGDMAVALAALGASVEVRGVDGAQRSVAIGDFHLLPEDTPEVETPLARGELVTGVTVPAQPAGAVMGYRKVRDRWSYAFALVSVAAVVRAGGGGTVADARIALGGMAPRPWRVPVAEAALVGRVPTREAVAAALAPDLAGARPLPDNAFKLDLAVDVVTATLRDLLTPRER